MLAKLGRIGGVFEGEGGNGGEGVSAIGLGRVGREGDGGPELISEVRGKVVQWVIGGVVSQCGLNRMHRVSCSLKVWNSKRCEWISGLVTEGQAC